MKLLFGRDQFLWVVSRKTGSVKRVPFSFFGCITAFILVVTVGTFSIVSALNHVANQVVSVDDMVSMLVSAREHEGLRNRNKVLEASLSDLQKKSEESQRLQARVLEKLNSLKGIVGEVSRNTGKLASKENKKDDVRASLNPAAWDGMTSNFNLPLGISQRHSIQRLDRVVRLLKGLPLGSPVDGGEINSKFGYRHSPFGNGVRFHQGVDISLESSGLIRSTGNGVIKSVERNSGYGIMIDIQHSRYVTTRYAHLSRVKVLEGQRVKAGEIIAVGGSTGHTTGRHLHYEIRLRNRALNPEFFLSLPDELQVVLMKPKAEVLQAG